MGVLDLSKQNQGISAFPNFTVPESEKDENYHRSFVEAITHQSFNAAYDISYAVMDESYRFYDGNQGGDEFKFLQQAEDGETLPAVWINYNRIRPKIDLLLGEFDRRGYEIRVRAINKEAVIRKRNTKEEMRSDVRLNPYLQNIEQQYNIPSGYNPNLPDNEAELEATFENWQDECETVMRYALKYLDKKYNWRYTRLATHRDVLIAGRGFVKCEIVNGYPTYRRLDPRDVVFDINATDDFLSDSTYFGVVTFMSIADAAQKYNLSDKDVADIYESNTVKKDKGPDEYVNVGNGTALTFMKYDGGDLRVLVVEAYWKDYTLKKKKYSMDKYGNEHVKEVADTYKNSDNVKSKLLSCWRQGTLIGNKVMRNWGQVPNQVRSIDDFYESDCPIKAIVPNWVNRNAISKTEVLKGLQKFKNITLYNLQKAMALAGAKGMVYDVAQLPDEWRLETMIKYMKVHGIMVINSKQDGIPSQFNQFSQFDQTLTNSITQYININEMIDREMDSISGINEARQGFMQGASQAVGVTQSALIQSSLATETLNSEMQMFASNVWTHMAGLMKLAWAYKERFAPIMTEAGIDFLSKDLELELDDYSVFIEEASPALQDIQTFQALVQAALQAQAIDFIDALKLMREADISQGIRDFERAYNKKQAAMQKAQQQQMQAEMQAKQEQQQALAAGQQQQQELANQGRLQQQELVNQGKQADGDTKLANTALQGHISLRGEQLKNLLARNLNDNNNQTNG